MEIRVVQEGLGMHKGRDRYRWGRVGWGTMGGARRGGWRRTADGEEGI